MLSGMEDASISKFVCPECGSAQEVIRLQTLPEPCDLPAAGLSYALALRDNRFLRSYFRIERLLSVRLSQKTRELWIPLLLLVVFFVPESADIISELSLAAFAIFLGAVMFACCYNQREYIVALVGLTGGTCLEIGFRVFGAQQHWTHASLFGVPYWLPIAWALLFVFITRVGLYIRGIRRYQREDGRPLLSS
jgi:hypothetical protein